MPIAITEPVVASLSHVGHGCPASLLHLANDCPMHYRFFTFWPWGLTPWPEVYQTWWRPAAGASLPCCKISAWSHKRSSRCALPFGLGAASSPKGKMTCYPPRSTILTNFIALRQPMPEISVTKKSCGQIKRTNDKETVNDISPACLSAYRDNKYWSVPIRLSCLEVWNCAHAILKSHSAFCKMRHRLTRTISTPPWLLQCDAG